jgi:two-component system response regulator RegA
LRAPEYAVVDLRLGDGCGLDVISALKERQSDARAIIVTGYGNIATAVEAIKLGAVDYLTKPADVDDIISILLAPTGIRTEAPSHPMSATRVRWEHILQVHESCEHKRRKLRDVSTCIGAHCSAFYREARISVEYKTKGSPLG